MCIRDRDSRNITQTVDSAVDAARQAESESFCEEVGRAAIWVDINTTHGNPVAHLFSPVKQTAPDIYAHFVEKWEHSRGEVREDLADGWVDRLASDCPQLSGTDLLRVWMQLTGSSTGDF